MPRKEVTTAAAEPTMEDGAIQAETTLPVRPRRHESLKGGPPASASDAGSLPRIPRITRLMALAIKFHDMVDRGEVQDYADLARLGYVTRARITQIMNLLNLAPDIQEEILFREAGSQKSGIEERVLRPLTSITEWADQREIWQKMGHLETALDRPPAPASTRS